LYGYDFKYAHDILFMNAIILILPIFAPLVIGTGGGLAGRAGRGLFLAGLPLAPRHCSDCFSLSETGWLLYIVRSYFPYLNLAKGAIVFFLLSFDPHNSKRN